MRVPPKGSCIRVAATPVTGTSAASASVSAAAQHPGVAAVDAAIEELLAAAERVEPHFKAVKRVQEAKVQAEVDKVVEAARAAGVNRVDAALNTGTFDGLLTTDLRAVTSDATLTFSRISFNRMQPGAQLIRMESKEARLALLPGVPSMIKGPWESDPQAYVVVSLFRVLQPQDGKPASLEEPPAPRDDDLLGLQYTVASWELNPSDPPERLRIVFKGIRIEPALPGKQLDAWLAALLPHNPGMDPKTGRVDFMLDPPLNGHLDYLAMTSRYQVSRGNLGSVVVVRPAPK